MATALDITMLPEVPTDPATPAANNPAGGGLTIPVTLRIEHTVNKRDIIYTIAIILLIGAGIKVALMLINFLLKVPV